MARTKADVAKKAGGKAPRKAPVLKNTPSSGGITKRKSRSSAGSRNVECKRPVPKWQVSVKDLDWVMPGSSKDVNLAPEPEVIDLEPEENSSTAGVSSAASAAAGSSEDPIPDSEDCDTSMNEENVDDYSMNENEVNGEKVAAEDNSMNVDQGNNGEVSTTNGFIKCDEDGSSEGEVGKEDPKEINEENDETYGTAENEKKGPKENDEGDYKDGKAEKEEEDPIENCPEEIEEGDKKNGKPGQEEEDPKEKEPGENADEDCKKEGES